MTTTIQYRIGPEQTPKAIRMLILLTCSATLLSGLLDSGAMSHLGLPSLYEIFSLSWNGLLHFFVWQPLTYPFIQQGAYPGISFNLLTLLFFNMFLLWSIGSTLIERLGTNAFLRLYLISAVVIGLVTIAIGELVGSAAVLSGCTPALMTLFVIWAMLNPETEILLFLVVPVKTKWILAGLVGGVLLINLSDKDFVSLTMYFTPLLIGYLYAVLRLELVTPFPIMHRMDEALVGMGQRWRRPKNNKLSIIQPKIVDFSTGEPVLDDDQFVDSMLEKISRSGERSLTPPERRRMEQISAHKRTHRQ